MPFLKKRKEKRKYVARPGIEPRTPDLRVRCPTDCATRPGLRWGEGCEAEKRAGQSGIGAGGVVEAMIYMCLIHISINFHQDIQYDYPVMSCTKTAIGIYQRDVSEDLYSELILSSLQLALCRVAAIKRLPVYHHRVDFLR